MTDATLDKLRTLAARSSIAPGYHDLGGQWHEPGEATLRVLLAALGCKVDDEAALDAALASTRHVDAPDPLPPVHVLHEGEALRIPVAPDFEARAHGCEWCFVMEDGARMHGFVREGCWEAAGHDADDTRLCLPLAMRRGYHRLTLLESGTEIAACTVIVAPAKAFQPSELLAGGRGFGLMLQLYSLRSADNWGIGDFTDLCAAASSVASMGVDFIGLNPLHAGFLAAPRRASPYSPSNRCFMNPIYLRPDDMADFADCDAAARWRESAPVQAELAALRAAPMVDYERVVALKLAAWRLAYDYFKRTHLGGATERGKAFQAFREAHGDALRLHAQWEADGLAGDHADPPELFEYLQWQTRIALHAAAAHLRENGMRAGLYLDLAVGVSRDGGEVHADPELFAPGASIGAPPDDFSPTGQNWALAPWNPHVLRTRAYKPFIDVLRAAMRDAGALRIDHVVGLLRQFWVPSGKGAAQGAYVLFPVRELLAVLALESQRNRCVIIGEDLGTVPDEMRTLLQEHGVLSYRVLYFERHWHHGQTFKQPQEFADNALVTVTTHDLPTLAGFFSCHDLRLRAELGKLPPGTSLEHQCAHRNWECEQLRDALSHAGLGDLPLVQSVHAFVARTPCPFLAVQIEDLLELEDQVNLPDTVDEHPNWRRRLDLPVESWAEDPRIALTCARIRAERDGDAGARERAPA